MYCPRERSRSGASSARFLTGCSKRGREQAIGLVALWVTTCNQLCTPQGLLAHTDHQARPRQSGKGLPRKTARPEAGRDHSEYITHDMTWVLMRNPSPQGMGPSQQLATESGYWLDTNPFLPLAEIIEYHGAVDQGE